MDIEIDLPRRDGHREGITVLDVTPHRGIGKKMDGLGNDGNTSELALDDLLEDLDK
jgi:hypothetical protein